MISIGAAIFLSILFGVFLVLCCKFLIPIISSGKPANGAKSSPQPNRAGVETDLLLASIPGFLCLKDASGKWLQASRSYQTIYHLTGFDCLGYTDYELCKIPNSDQDALHLSEAKDQEAWELGRSMSEPLVVNVGDGNASQISFELTRTPIFDHNQNRFRLLVTGNPLEGSFCADSNVFTSVFYLNKLPFLLLDSDLKTVDVNYAFTAFTGYSKRDTLGQYFVFLDSQVNAEKYGLVISAFLRQNQQQPWSAETDCHCKNGRVVPIRLVVSRIVTKIYDSKQIHYLVYLADIRKQKEDENRLIHIAHYDELTGLPNRVLFLERLTRSLFLGARHKLHSSVIFIDLDRFKSVNESLGHQAGNDLLIEVANRLNDAFKNESILARFSSDEFAIMHLNEQSHEKAVVASSMIAQQVVSLLTKPFLLHNQELYVSISIGVAVFPEDAHTPEVLLKNADIAMHEAKKQGSNNIHFFQKQYTSKARERHQLESNLRRALQRNELKLFYQPQYDATTQQLCGAEVLIRWLQGQTKMISPYFFIDVAEETGFIIPMGKWILETACKQIKLWLAAGYALQQVSVNVSARQFMDPHFVETVEGALHGADLPAEHLELEITESMLIGDPKRIELQLNRFKKMGITIALDDFGTGYSSLAYLKNFPIDVVKIDQSFVRGMTPGSTDARIVCAIIEMGHSLGYKVVAEGVETEAQFHFLREKGCDIIQGYYFCKPLPLVDMTTLLSGQGK